MHYALTIYNAVQGKLNNLTPKPAGVRGQKRVTLKLPGDIARGVSWVWRWGVRGLVLERPRGSASVCGRWWCIGIVATGLCEVFRALPVVELLSLLNDWTGCAECDFHSWWFIAWGRWLSKVLLSYDKYHNDYDNDCHNSAHHRPRNNTTRTGTSAGTVAIVTIVIIAGIVVISVGAVISGSASPVCVNVVRWE